MAKNDALLKAIISRISGALGDDLIVKNYNGRLYISKFPARSKKGPTEKQVCQRTRFTDAQAYARKSIKDEKALRRMRKKLLPGQRAYNQFIAEYLRDHAI